MVASAARGDIPTRHLPAAKEDCSSDGSAHRDEHSKAEGGDEPCCAQETKKNYKRLEHAESLAASVDFSCEESGEIGR